MPGTNRPRRLGWFVRLLAGLFIFWVAFRDVDVAATGRAFALVDGLWLGASLLSVLLTLGPVVLRWRVLLDCDLSAKHAAILTSAVIASQVSNIIMPFRLGDAVRIGAVSRALSLPPAGVLGSVAVERLFDALLVALTAILLVAMGALPPFAEAGMLSLGISLALGFGALVALVHWRRQIGGTLWRAGKLLPLGIREWILAQADALLRGLHRLKNPRIAVMALFWSAFVMGGSILSTWFLLRAFEIGAPVWSAAVIVIVLQIGSVIVPVPGAVGIAQVLTVQTLSLWGVPEALALAFALMLYLVARVPKLALLPFALAILTPATEKAG